MSALLSIKEGIHCNPNRIKQIMRHYGLESQHRNVEYNLAICNFLKANYCNHIIHEHTLPLTYNEQWTVQIVPFKINNATRHLICWIDLYNHQVVNYEILSTQESISAYTIRRYYKRLCKKLGLVKLPYVLPPDCIYSYKIRQNYTNAIKDNYVPCILDKILNDGITSISDLRAKLDIKLVPIKNINTIATIA